MTPRPGEPQVDAEDELAPDRIRAVPLRRTGTWLAVVVVVVVAVVLIRALALNPDIGWDVVGRYLTAGEILRGVVVTVELSVLAEVMGIVLGVLLAVMRLSGNVVLRSGAGLYIWFFRGTPLLVQLLFWYNLALVLPRLSLGVPFGPTLASVPTNQVLTGFVAALLGLGLNEAAYLAEIVRAGILSIDVGQGEAAAMVGMTRARALRVVILPQAMRLIVPPTGNQFISMLKTSSLVSVISGSELLTRTQAIYTANFEVVALLIVASFWYLVLTTVASVGQGLLERRLASGSRPGMARRIRANLNPLTRAGEA